MAGSTRSQYIDLYISIDRKTGRSRLSFEKSRNEREFRYPRRNIRSRSITIASASLNTLDMMYVSWRLKEMVKRRLRASLRCDLIGNGRHKRSRQGSRLRSKNFHSPTVCWLLPPPTGRADEGVARHSSRRKYNILGVNRGDTLDYASFLSRWRQRGGGGSPERIGAKIIRGIAISKLAKARAGSRKGSNRLLLRIAGHDVFSMTATMFRAGRM